MCFLLTLCNYITVHSAQCTVRSAQCAVHSAKTYISLNLTQIILHSQLVPRSKHF